MDNLMNLALPEMARIVHVLGAGDKGFCKEDLGRITRDDDEKFLSFVDHQANGKKANWIVARAMAWLWGEATPELGEEAFGNWLRLVTTHRARLILPHGTHGSTYWKEWFIHPEYLIGVLRCFEEDLSQDPDLLSTLLINVYVADDVNVSDQGDDPPAPGWKVSEGDEKEIGRLVKKVSKDTRINPQNFLQLAETRKWMAIGNGRLKNGVGPLANCLMEQFTYWAFGNLPVEKRIAAITSTGPQTYS